MFRLKWAIIRCVTGTLEGKLKQKYIYIYIYIYMSLRRQQVCFTLKEQQITI